MKMIGQMFLVLLVMAAGMGRAGADEEKVNLSEDQRLARMDKAMDCAQQHINDDPGITWSDVCSMDDAPAAEDDRQQNIDAAMARLDNDQTAAIIPNRAPAAIKPNSFEIGPEISYITYRERSLGVTEKGFMYGIYGIANIYANQEEGELNSIVDVYHFDFHANYGQVDYQGSGQIKGISDYMFEPRFWMGKNFDIGGQTQITPYTGIGYRFLYDALGGTTSSTGAWGYDRRSQYVYLPLGFELKMQTSPEWEITFNPEFDILLRGWQDSYLSDGGPAYGDVHNTQKKGIGVRASLKFIKRSENCNITFGPYIRYWHIQNSNVSTSVGGSIKVVGYEPENTSTEIGGRLGVEF